MRFKLHHLTGSKAGQIQELEGQVITVGRDPSNTIAYDPVQDDKVSGFHANLTVQGEQVLLTDLGSSNGTYFNGQKLGSPMPIISGANLQFGEGGPIVVVEFPVGAAAPAPAAAAPGAAPVAAAGAAAVAAPAPAAGAPPPAAAPPPAGAPPAAAPPPAAAAPPPAAAAPPPGQPDLAAAQAAAFAEADAAKAASDKEVKKKGMFSKARCAGCGMILGLLLVCVLGIAAWKGQEYLRRNFPTTTRYLKKIPVVGKFFKAGDKARSNVQKAKAAKNKAARPGREAGKVKEELTGD